MTQGVVFPHSLRLGEVFALALGLGLSTLAVSARVYTKSKITKTMGREDCECAPLNEFHHRIIRLIDDRCIRSCLGRLLAVRPVKYILVEVQWLTDAELAILLGIRCARSRHR